MLLNKLKRIIKTHIYIYKGVKLLETIAIEVYKYLLEKCIDGF